MELNQTIEIDLAKYGVKDGSKIVMSEPTFKRSNEMYTAARKYMKMKKTDKGIEIDPNDMEYNNLEIVYAMSYIKTAPFKLTVDGFVDFTELLDEIKIGQGKELFDEIKANVERISGGELSPLSNSPEAGTENSA